MHQQEQSSQVAQHVALQRWLFWMLITQISKSSLRLRSAKRTRSAHFVTQASIWISAARTSSLFSTRTPTTQFAYPMLSCAHTRTRSSSDLLLVHPVKLSKPLMLVNSSARWQKPLGHVLIQEFNMTTPSTNGTPTQRLDASMPPTHALSTCHSITLHATSHH
ncbi:unannotated protein [freshwater metagenome]|uniref:Unannotated protein n=1 Tax=freshwater metagenome TaxID=449393 RepID=A0A6J7R8G9_9ZZZZ